MGTEGATSPITVPTESTAVSSLEPGTVRIERDRNFVYPGIRRTLNNFANRYKVAVVASIPHGELSEPTYVHGQVDVRFYSAPGPNGAPGTAGTLKTQRRLGETRLLGEVLCSSPSQRKMVMPTGIGTVLSDPTQDCDDAYYAEVVGNTVYVLFDLPHTPCGCGYTRELLAEVLRQASRYLDLSARPLPEFDPEEGRARYARGFAASNERRERRLQQEIAEYDAIVRERMRDLADATRKRQAIAAEQATISGVDPDALRGAFDTIRAFPGLSEATATSDHLRVFTENITIRHEDATYNIGEFEMRIPFNSSDQILLINRTRKIGGFDHPHVNEGKPCWGNTKSIVSSLLGTGRMLDLIQLLLVYLNSYSDENPHYKIENWPTIDGERSPR